MHLREQKLTQTSAGGQNATFTYGRLKNHQRQSTAVSDSAFQYIPFTGTTNYTTANANNGYTSAGAANFTYDGNSNLTFDGLNNLTYDVENRLIQAQNGVHGQSQYLYDPLGHRKQKLTSGVTTQFVLAGDEEIADFTGTGVGTAQMLTVRGVGGLPWRKWCQQRQGPRKRSSIITANTQSSQGVDFTKQFEGYSSTVYSDSAGNPTIGYGHLITAGQDFGSGITNPQATTILSQDTQKAVTAVNNQVTACLTQNQFDAVVDFTYNVGSGGLGNSTLLSNINSGNVITQNNFTNWNQAGGQVVPGLTIRRMGEYNLFVNGAYGSH